MLPFQEYVDTNGLESLDKMLKCCEANRTLLNPITSILVDKMDDNGNELGLNADSIPDIVPGTVLQPGQF